MRTGTRRASSHAYGAPELDRSFGAPEDTVQRGLRHLAEHKRDLPAGTLRLRRLGLPRRPDA